MFTTVDRSPPQTTKQAKYLITGEIEHNKFTRGMGELVLLINKIKTICNAKKESKIAKIRLADLCIDLVVVFPNLQNTKLTKYRFEAK